MLKHKLSFLIILFLIFLLIAWVVAGLLATGPLFVIVGLILRTCGATMLGVYILVSRLRNSPVATEVPRTQSPSDIDQDFAKAVQRLILDANQSLRRSPVIRDKTHGSPIHQLGFHVVSGLGAAGKTSTIAASGFGVERLSGQTDAGGVISRTDLGNFWFAENSVLAEASSAIFADDSKWRTWLRKLSTRPSVPLMGGLLKGFQTTSNLRGVVLFCDVTDLVGVPDAARQSALARTVRERLNAISEIFRSNFPVYVVFSKADRVAFFHEYFGRLIGEEDQQVLGCTLDRTPERKISPGVFTQTQTQEVSDAFNSLYLSLTDKRLLYLARETDPSRKSGIYEFPREVKRIRSSVVQFLVDAFQPNALTPGPVLRGFYFTGIRQVTDAFPAHADGPQTSLGGQATRLFKAQDFQAISLSEKLGARGTPERLTPKWAFVTRLFRDVILADQKAAPISPQGSSRVNSSAWAATAAAICLVWVALVLWSYINNRALLGRVEKACQLLSGEGAAQLSAQSLDEMDALRRNLVDLENFRKHVPWRLNFLLYSGDLVHDSAETIYFSRFEKYFLDGTNKALTAQLSSLPSDPNSGRPLAYEAAYNRLRAYLMITSRACRSQRPFLPLELAEVWSSSDGADRSLNSTVVFNQFDFFAQHLTGPSGPLNLALQETAVKAGRSYLVLFANEQRAYQQIIDEVNQQVHESARLTDYAPEYPSVIAAHPDEIPAAFTRAGWHEVQDRIMHAKANSLGDSCVTGAESKEGTVLDDLNYRSKLADLYAEGYASHWRDFLSSLHVTPYAGASDAAKKLTILDGNSSPLMLALYMVHENTQVIQALPSKVDTQVKAGATGLLNRWTSRMGTGAKAVVTGAVAAAKTGQRAEISKIFEPVHILFPADATRGKWGGDNNRKYLDALGSMARAMDALGQGNSSATDAALNIDASRSYADGREKVRQIAFDFDRDSDRLSNSPDDVAKAVNDLLLEPFVRANGLFSSDPDKVAAQKTGGDLKGFCSSLEPLLNKFPFKRSGKDATLSEFTSVFSPQTGTLAALSQKVSNVAVRLSGTWQKTAASANVPVSPDFLAAMNRLSGISDAFFESRPDAHLEYRLSTLPDPSYQSTKINIDGRGVSSGQSVSWPGSNGGLQIVVVSGPANISCAVYGGTWAVFHLLADARQNGSELTYPCFSLGLGGGAVPIEIGNKQLVLGLRFEASTAAKALSDPSFFQGIRCPSRVVDTK